jgi:hypothetical protein
MICEDQIFLVANYGGAIAAYYAAVVKLEQGVISGSREIYAERRLATEEARLLCETARKELDQHIAEHGCAPEIVLDLWQVSS